MRLLIFILLILAAVPAFSQDSVNLFRESTSFSKPRFIKAVAVQAVGYGGSLAALGAAWYKEHERTPFHTFDDSQEWLQMDKAGHVLTSWYLARMNMDMLQWSGVEKKKAVWYGAAGSFLYLTGIEMLDGYSDGWGFSWSDMGANAAGSFLIAAQATKRVARTSTRQRNGVTRQYHRKRNWFTGMSLKYSFHTTGYPELRPALLGNSFAEQMLKDYNGQTYWLSFNISSMLWEEQSFPKWLNVSLGYGAEGMISGHQEFVQLDNGTTVWMERYRQFYLSVDIDASRIRTRSRFLKTLFETFSFIKIPAPAMEWSKKGVRFHPLYF